MPSATHTVESNGVKALVAAAALGLATGAGGTYKIADDYNREITAMKVEAARTECKIGLLLKSMD